jgi:hypothetical protein
LIGVLLLLALVAQVDGASRPVPAGTVVEATLEGGSFAVELEADLDLLMLGLSPAATLADRLLAMERLQNTGDGAQQAAIERLAALFRRRLRVRFDGAPAAFAVEFPALRRTASGELSTLGGRVRLHGAVPPGAGAVTFFASRSFRGVDLRVVAGGGRSRQILEPGEESAPIALGSK